MKHSLRFRVLTLLLLVGLLAALPFLGGCDKDDDATGGSIAADDGEAGDDEGEEADDADDTAEDEDEAGDVDEADDDDAVAPADGSGTGTDANAPSTVTVRLYWVEAGENALGVERSLPYTEAVATAAMNALLAGPTPEEQATWPAISTTIPAGTQLLGVTVANGVAKVDLSQEFESGGGTFSVTARLAQVVYTLEQFPTVDAVEFYIEGVRVEMFSGEGLMLDGPQTLDDYDSLLPIDA